jgi:hypothetical protein
MHPPGPDSHDAVEATADALDEISCRDFVEMITDYFEDALGPRQLEHVEEHLVMCDWCVAYLSQFDATLDALGELGSEREEAIPAPDLSTLTELETPRSRNR